MKGRAMEAVLTEYWAPIAGAVAFIVWLVRLEAGMKRNRDEIEDLRTEMKAEQKLSTEHRLAITSKLDVLSRALDSLETTARTTQADVKHILEKL